MAKKANKQAQPQRMLVMKQSLNVSGSKVKSTEVTYEVDGTVYPKSLIAGVIGSDLQYNAWVPVGMIETIKDVKGTVCVVVDGMNIVIRDDSQFAIIELGTDEEEAEAPKKGRKSKKTEPEPEDDDLDDEDDDDEDEDEDEDDGDGDEEEEEEEEEDDDDDRLDLDDDEEEDDEEEDDEEEDDEEEDDEEEDDLD